MISPPPEQALLDKASMLVDAASILGVGTYTEFGEQIPIVFDITTEQWDWVFTIAGVFIAASRLATSRIPGPQQDAIMDIVSPKLVAWKPDAGSGFEDCKEAFERAYDTLAGQPEYMKDDRLLASDALSVWMAVNLLGHLPESEVEMRLARTVGVAVVHSFHNWWDVD